MEITPCDSCPATCCRRYVVDILLVDAYRIATTLRIAIDDFAEPVWSEEPDEDRRILLATLRRHYRLVLRRNPIDDENQSCVFLLSVGQRGLCGIYGIRPEICRTYPARRRSGTVTTGGGRSLGDHRQPLAGRRRARSSRLGVARPHER